MFHTLHMTLISIPFLTRSWHTPDIFLTFLLVLNIPHPTRDINRYNIPDMFLIWSWQHFFLFWISHALHVTLISIAFLTCSRQRFFLFWKSYAQHMTSIGIAFLTCSQHVPDKLLTMFLLPMPYTWHYWTQTKCLSRWFQCDKTIPGGTIRVRQVWEQVGGLHYSNLKGLLITFRRGSSIYWNLLYLFQPTTKSWWGEKKLILGRHMYIYGRKYSFPHLGISAFFCTETPVPRPLT